MRERKRYYSTDTETAQRLNAHEMEHHVRYRRTSEEANNMRDETPGWLLFTYEHVSQNNELIKKAWAHCKVGKWDLSYENLASTAALDCLDTFFRFFEQGGLVMAQGG